MHTAARAGVPQQIVPHATDPFFWRKRVEQLGLCHAATASSSRPRNSESPDHHHVIGALKQKKIRQRPTLPRGFPRSTIGSGGLNFRVRDGNGCDPSDIATGKLVINRTYEG